MWIGAERLRVSGSRIVVLKRIVSLQYGIETRQVWQTGSTRFERVVQHQKERLAGRCFCYD